MNYINPCEKAEAEVKQTPERVYLLDFVRNSKRGVIKPYVKKNREE
jgi:UDP-N-acetylglucosamine acyltransferase